MGKKLGKRHGFQSHLLNDTELDRLVDLMIKNGFKANLYVAGGLLMSLLGVHKNHDASEAKEYWEEIKTEIDRLFSTVI
jgi:hypothetical protein